MQLPERPRGFVRGILATVFLWSCVVLLTLTAIGKFSFAAQDARLLLYQDPLMFFLSRRAVIVIAGILELVVVGILLRAESLRLKLGALAWLSAIFAIYRSFLALGHYALPCNCVGSLATIFGLQPGATDIISKWLFLYLAILSWAFFLWEWRGRRWPGKDLAGVELRHSADYTRAGGSR